ncbi:MAG: hypothetical protein CM15mP70_04050 [Pelagibacteraceae bacterium]|nr:MAG: hypothetical protein CM15mP70_04050 [Pelagibacteraceae bacterium]
MTKINLSNFGTLGYPDQYPKDTHIRNLNEFPNDDHFYIFHAAQKIDENILTNGGRVLSLVAIGVLMRNVEIKFIKLLKNRWDQKYYRKDIGANF